MNYKLIGILVVFFLQNIITAQPSSDERIVKSMAENILLNTSYDFINKNTGEIFNEINANNYSPDISINSPYTTWHYWNGVLNLAMMDLATYFNEPKYREQAINNYAVAFKKSGIFRDKYTPD